MAIHSEKEIKVNLVIKFRSKNPYDNELHTGVVTALCDYDIAKNFNDIVRYNEEVRGVDPDIPDEDVLNYFILKDGVSGVPIAYAKEWIEKGSLIIVDIPIDAYIKIFNINNKDIEEVIRLLSDNGFVAKEIKNVE